MFILSLHGRVSVFFQVKERELGKIDRDDEVL